ncbi:hypothetical protein Q2941_49655 [Bradyrhizobium sp. UFLA05-153]
MLRDAGEFIRDVLTVPTSMPSKQKWSFHPKSAPNGCQYLAYQFRGRIPWPDGDANPSLICRIVTRISLPSSPV